MYQREQSGNKVSQADPKKWVKSRHHWPDRVFEFGIKYESNVIKVDMHLVDLQTLTFLLIKQCNHMFTIDWKRNDVIDIDMK